MYPNALIIAAYKYNLKKRRLNYIYVSFRIQFSVEFVYIILPRSELQQLLQWRFNRGISSPIWISECDVAVNVIVIMVYLYKNPEWV